METSLATAFRRPVFVHHFKLVAVFVAGDVVADHFPAVAAVGASKHLVGSHIQGGFVVFAQDEGAVPVPSVMKFTFSRLGFDFDGFATGFVVAVDVAVLIGRIHNVGVIFLNGLPEAVATEGYNPFVARNAVIFTF